MKSDFCNKFFFLNKNSFFPKKKMSSLRCYSIQKKDFLYDVWVYIFKSLLTMRLCTNSESDNNWGKFYHLYKDKMNKMVLLFDEKDQDMSIETIFPESTNAKRIYEETFSEYYAGFAFLIEDEKKEEETILNICFVKPSHQTQIMKYILENEKFNYLKISCNFNTFFYYFLMGFRFEDDKKINTKIEDIFSSEQSFFEIESKAKSIIQQHYENNSLLMILDLKNFDMDYFNENIDEFSKNQLFSKNSLRKLHFQNSDTQWNNLMENIRQHWKFLCQDINAGYIEELSQDEKNTDLFIVSKNWDQNGNNKTLINNFAFAIAKRGYFRTDLDSISDFKQTDYLYIDLICSDQTFKNAGLGSVLMEYIMEKSEEIGVKYICLSSVSSAMGFYLRLGFELAFHCETNDEKKSLTSRLKDLFEKNKPTSNLEDDPEFLDLLYEASKQGLAIDSKKCKTEPDKSCLMNGLYMILCLEKRTKQIILTSKPTKLIQYFAKKRKNDSSTESSYQNENEPTTFPYLKKRIKI